MKHKRFLAVLLTLIMILSLCPLQAFAAVTGGSIVQADYKKNGGATLDVTVKVMHGSELLESFTLPEAYKSGWDMSLFLTDAYKDMYDLYSLKAEKGSVSGFDAYTTSSTFWYSASFKSDDTLTLQLLTKEESYVKQQQEASTIYGDMYVGISRKGSFKLCGYDLSHGYADAFYVLQEGKFTEAFQQYASFESDGKTYLLDHVGVLNEHVRTLYFSVLHQKWYYGIWGDNTNVVVSNEGQLNFWYRSAPAVKYTVTYTDGVSDETVFPDQAYTVTEGEPTPQFSGTPARDGYEFTGWTPEPAETVTGDAVYTATWRSVSTGKYRLTYSWSVPAGITLNGAEKPADTAYTYADEAAARAAMDKSYTAGTKKAGSDGYYYRFSGWTAGTVQTSGTDKTLPLSGKWTRTGDRVESMWKTVSVTAGNGGSTDKTGTNTILAGKDFSVKATPAKGWCVDKMTVDGTAYDGLSSYTLSNVTADHSISFSFAADSNGDGIPDKVQRSVSFRAVNGKMSGETEKTFAVMLTDKDGAWSENGTAAVTVPTVTPDSGYKAGSWSPAVASSALTVTKDSASLYIYTCTADSQNVSYRDADKDENGDNLPDEVTEEALKGQKIWVDPGNGSKTYELPVNGAVRLEDPTFAGHCFRGWRKGSKTGYAFSLTGQWEADADGDGVPDRYQKTVSFKAENGTLDGNREKTVTVTLKDKNGRWDEKGSAVLTVPAVEPDTGYQAGSWTPAPGGDRLTVTKDSPAEYLYRCEEDRQEITFPDAEKDEDGDNLPDEVTEEVLKGQKIWIDPANGSAGYELTVDGALQPEQPVYAGHTFLGWIKGEKAGYVFSLTAKWGVDANGDGIPDQYQKTVGFAAENGMIDGGKRKDVTVTLTNADGLWDEKGSAEVPVPEVVPDPGYKAGVWTPAIGGDTLTVTKDSPAVYTCSCPVDEPDVRYKDADTDENKDNIPDEIIEEVQKGLKIWVDPANGSEAYELTVEDGLQLEDPEYEGYLFRGWRRGEKEGYAFSLTGQWDEDADGDGIPDKCQRTVVLEAENGTIDGEKRKELPVVLTDEDGLWDENGTAEVPVPQVTPDSGYKEGSWSPAIEGNTLTVSGDSELNYRYTCAVDDPDVRYRDADRDEDGDGKPDEVTEEVQKGMKIWIDPANGSEAYELTVVDDTLALEEPVYAGHIFRGWSRSEKAGYAFALTGQWDEDANGDGIPDRFQKTVSFEVENGTIDGEKRKEITVTLRDEQGRLDENGAARVPVPEVTPAPDYKNGRWDPAIEGDTLTVGKDTQLAYTYVCEERSLWEEYFTPDGTPLRRGKSTWALVNLILTVLTAAAAVLMLLRNRKKAEQTEERRGLSFLRWLGIPLALVSVLAFCFSEKLGSPMVLTDRFTALMAVLAALQGLVLFLSRRKTKADTKAEAV